MLIIGGSGSGKTNALLNLINNQPDIDKIYLYAKDSQLAKYQYLINKRETVGLKHYDDLKSFIEYSNDMQDVYKNIELAKHQYLINKRETVSLKHYDYPKVFIEYSNDMQDVYKNIEEYNPGKKRKI